MLRCGKKRRKKKKEKKGIQSSPNQSISSQTSLSGLSRLALQGSQGLSWVLCPGAVVPEVPSHSSRRLYLSSLLSASMPTSGPSGK